MLKEITEVNEKTGVMRITTLNERWYARPRGKNPDTGLPEYEYKPSSTWIAGYYPKGIGFFKWLAEKGWDEAEAIKISAGDKGTKVHHACEDIDLGRDVKIDAKYLNKTTGKEEELTVEEYGAIMSYIDFIEEYKPVLLANEITSFGDFYGGTADKIFAIHNELLPALRQIWIVDIKTGQSIWQEQELQISSYSHMAIDYKALGITDEEWAARKLATLQVGYRKNKAGYKFTEVADQYDLFKNVAFEIWKNENKDAKPKEKDYPMVISSAFRKAQVAKEEAGKEVSKEELSTALLGPQEATSDGPELIEPKHKKIKKA